MLQARTFVCRRDKFGLTAGDLAVDQGHTQLGLLLRDFQQKPAVGGERRSAGGTVAFAGASGILPSGLSNTSVAAMLQEQQAKERQRLSAGLSPLGSDAPGPMTASGEGAGATVKRVGPALAAAQAPSRLSVNAGEGRVPRFVRLRRRVWVRGRAHQGGKDAPLLSAPQVRQRGSSQAPVREPCPLAWASSCLPARARRTARRPQRRPHHSR